MLGKLKDFFAVRRNVIFKRAQFNHHNQREGESAEQYITALYQLVETCDYKELTDEMLRDRLVVEIRDTGLSEWLQVDAALTLEMAKKTIREKEAVKEQHKQLQRDGSKTNPFVIDEVKESRLRAGKGGSEPPDAEARERC